MGLFGKLFDKKECAFCGKEIGLLGNRKLEDGNMCKECASNLSPWFSERRHSTVAEIQSQLDAREANKSAVAAFHISRTFGDEAGVKVFIDENARKFMVARQRELEEGNPDVIDFSQVTDVVVDINEEQDEKFRTDGDGDRESYYPPRYIYRYDIRLLIYLNHPYLDEIHFNLSPNSITTNFMMALPLDQKPNPRSNHEFRKYERMAIEAKAVLMSQNGNQPMNQYSQPLANGWTCACGAVVNGNFCPQCGAKKPEPKVAGGWTCACGTVVSGNFCPECGAKKPVAANFCCDKCGWTPEPGAGIPKFCPECGDPFDEDDMA